MEEIFAIMERMEELGMRLIDADVLESRFRIMGMNEAAQMVREQITTEPFIDFRNAESIDEYKKRIEET